MKGPALELLRVALILALTVLSFAIGVENVVDVAALEGSAWAQRVAKFLMLP